MEPQFDKGMPGARHDAYALPDPAAQPSAQPSARRRETQLRLLDAATAVFSELGLQGASVEAICARAGFSRGAFYSNFSSKEQLFLALLEREFGRRADDVASKALELEPLIAAHDGSLTPAEAASYIARFFGPSDDATAWFVLEAEFLLLAMRDPELAPGHQMFMDGFYASIAGVVERVLAAAGRKFSLPTHRAIPVLSGVYERALRAAALAGPGSHADLDELGERLAELLFALTEPR
ncbi:TetR/AcrR family transcriptional regulator [Leucobacter sp. HY1908]